METPVRARAWLSRVPSLAGFLDSLKPSKLDERVVVLVFSEFGRRLKENANGGTDHGAAAPVLIAGRAVQGGRFGPHPNLADLDETGDPRFAVDFRDLYASLIRRWLDVDPTPILGERKATMILVSTRASARRGRTITTTRGARRESRSAQFSRRV